MSHSLFFRPGLGLACCLAICSPLTALAQGSADADTREVTAYVLTEAGLAKFKQAQVNLAGLGDSIAGDCDDDDEGVHTLDSVVAEINSAPGAAAAIESAGMPVREYVVFTFSLLHTGMAAWAQDQQGQTPPATVSTGNVAFYRAHEAELQEAASLGPADPCDGSEDDYDGYEEGEYEEDGYEE